MISVIDELNELKDRLKTLGLEVHKFEKIGNGNMSAFRVFYSLPNVEEVKEGFFWRHDMETFEKKMEIMIKGKHMS